MKVQLDKGKGIKHYYATEVRIVGSKSRLTNAAAVPAAYSSPTPSHTARIAHKQQLHRQHTPASLTDHSYTGLIAVILLNIVVGLINLRLTVVTKQTEQGALDY